MQQRHDELFMSCLLEPLYVLECRKLVWYDILALQQLTSMHMKDFYTATAEPRVYVTAEPDNFVQ